MVFPHLTQNDAKCASDMGHPMFVVEPGSRCTQYSEASGAEMIKYTVVFEQSTNGWGAYVPDLPGLGVVGDTLEETRQLIREGIEFHIEGLRKSGQRVPAPSTLVEQMDVKLPA